MSRCRGVDGELRRTVGGRSPSLRRRARCTMSSRRSSRCSDAALTRAVGDRGVGAEPVDTQQTCEVFGGAVQLGGEPVPHRHLVAERRAADIDVDRGPIVEADVASGGTHHDGARVIGQRCRVGRADHDRCGLADDEVHRRESCHGRRDRIRVEDRDRVAGGGQRCGGLGGDVVGRTAPLAGHHDQLPPSGNGGGNAVPPWCGLGAAGKSPRPERLGPRRPAPERAPQPGSELEAALGSRAGAGRDDDAEVDQRPAVQHTSQVTPADDVELTHPAEDGERQPWLTERVDESCEVGERLVLLGEADQRDEIPFEGREPEAGGETVEAHVGVLCAAVVELGGSRARTRRPVRGAARRLPTGGRARPRPSSCPPHPARRCVSDRVGGLSCQT